jgi:hypothetical protein
LKILYAWEWGTGSGHLRRFLPLASRLRDAGHQVAIVAKELHRLPRLFPLQDYRWIQAPESGRANDIIANACSFADVAFNLGFDSDDKVLSVSAAWKEILSQERPDLVISDFGVACLWVACAMRIPTLRIGTGYTCPPQGTESTSFLDGVPGTSRTAEAIMASMALAMIELRFGHKPCWNDVLLPSNRTILASVPTLDPYMQFRCEADYTGTWDHEGSTEPEWQGNGKYRAIAYLKPFPQLRQLIASLHSSGIETLLYGDGIPRALIEPVLNPLLRVSDAPLRLSGLTNVCDLVICNGNHGTIAKALGQGVPVFSIPLFLEQRVNADRIQREGWGVSADPRNADQFIAKCLEVTSDPTRDSASRYPELVAQYNSRSLDHAWDKLQPFLG